MMALSDKSASRYLLWKYMMCAPPSMHLQRKRGSPVYSNNSFPFVRVTLIVSFIIYRVLREAHRAAEKVALKYFLYFRDQSRGSFVKITHMMMDT